MDQLIFYVIDFDEKKIKVMERYDNLDTARERLMVLQALGRWNSRIEVVDTSTNNIVDTIYL